MKNLNKRAKSGIFQSLISKKSRKGVLALSQIFLLVVSIFAVSWALGSQIGVVSGQQTLEYPTRITIEGAVWERTSYSYFRWYCVSGQCPDEVSGVYFPLHLCNYYIDDIEILVRAGYTCEQGRIVKLEIGPLGLRRIPISLIPTGPETIPITPELTRILAEKYRLGRNIIEGQTALAKTGARISFEGGEEYYDFYLARNGIIRRYDIRTQQVDAKITPQADGSYKVFSLDEFGYEVDASRVSDFDGPTSYSSSSPLAMVTQAQEESWFTDPGTDFDLHALLAADTNLRLTLNRMMGSEADKTVGGRLINFAGERDEYDRLTHDYYIYYLTDGSHELRKVSVDPANRYVDAIYKPEGDGYRVYVLNRKTGEYSLLEGAPLQTKENSPLTRAAITTIETLPPLPYETEAQSARAAEARARIAEAEALEQELEKGEEAAPEIKELSDERVLEILNNGRRGFRDLTKDEGTRLPSVKIDIDDKGNVYDYYLMDDGSIRKVSTNRETPYVTAIYKPDGEEGYDVYTATGCKVEDYYGEGKSPSGKTGSVTNEKFNLGINEANWRNPAEIFKVGGVNYEFIGKDAEGNPIYKDPTTEDQYSLGKTDGKLGTFDGELVTPVMTAAAKAVQSFHWGIPFRAGGFWDSIVGGAKWGLYTKGIFAGAEYFFGSSEFFQKYAPMLEQSAKYGIAVGRAIQIGLTDVSATQTGWLTRLGTKKILTLNNILTPTSAGILWGGLTAAYFFYKNYKTEDTSIIAFSCYTWEPPVGGETCEVCNDKGELPCTEYQCKSLGQACELINQGTGEEKCVWINREDVNAPEIEAWDYVLSEEYVYNPEGVTFPHEADRGVKIEYGTEGDKCIPAFSPLQFGVHVIGGGKDNRPEPAKCKVDSVRKDGFDDMSFYMSNSISKYNHSYFVNLPSLEATEEAGIIIPTGGEFNVYVRCMDSNGNANIGNFVFNFCVEPGPDTTPALIIGNSFVSTTAPIRYGLNETYIQIYLDEPAECKWGHTDQGYNDMAGEMTCQSDVSGVEDLRAVYVCDSTLTGLRNRVDNNFYFRCNDSSGNINKESYKITLAGTQPLVIDHAGPNEETIKDSTDVVQVTLEAITSAGYDEGDATCYYSSTGVESDYISFFYETGTSSYLHTQILWRPGSVDGISHTYYIKCQDGGGNMDNETITFTVQTDLNAPRVVRVYHEEDYLKIITNEPADCVYDVVDCSYVFEDGIIMTSVADTSHFTDWETNTNFYIKCKDEYENQPDPDQCNIIVRPLEL